MPRAADLYSPEIVPNQPEFTVKNLIRRSGLHLVWAEPSAGKTWTLLRFVHELLSEKTSRLVGHPDLWINRRWSRALWIATEEDASTLRFKADAVRLGLDGPEIGTLLYLFAADRKHRITLDDLPAIIEAEGPLDAIVLDSLTGLRPKTVNGERVRWDVDNDAANEMCLRLRGLATEHGLAIILVHHTGRDTSKGYRGPTDWWASADVMFGLVPESGRTKLQVGKNRDGARIAPFLIEPAWIIDNAQRLRYEVTYFGATVDGKLTPSAEKVLAWYMGKRSATQKQAVAAGLGARSTVQTAIRQLKTEGLLRETGELIDKSPVYEVVEASARQVPDEVPDSEAEEKTPDVRLL